METEKQKSRVGHTWSTRRQGQKESLAEHGDSNDLRVAKVTAEQRPCPCTVFLVSGYSLIISLPVSLHSPKHNEVGPKRKEVNRVVGSSHTLKYPPRSFEYLPEIGLEVLCTVAPTS